VKPSTILKRFGDSANLNVDTTARASMAKKKIETKYLGEKHTYMVKGSGQRFLEREESKNSLQDKI